MLTIAGTGQTSTQAGPVSINHANSFTWQIGCHGAVPDGIQRRSPSYPPSVVSSTGVNTFVWDVKLGMSQSTAAKTTYQFRLAVPVVKVSKFSSISIE